MRMLEDTSRVPPLAIDEGLFAPVNGETQWLTLRGADLANPPLLILTGPGAAFSGLAPYFAPWEAAFTLVQWDQPHAGATYGRHGAPAAYDFARLTRDAAAVVEFALARLGARKLIVLGVSGGSVIGLNLAKARPDLIGAYVGTGQIVHWAQQEAQSYAIVLARAHAAGDAEAIAALGAIGPPPWTDIAADAVKGQYANAPTPTEAAAFAQLARVMAGAPPGGAYRAHETPPHDVRAVATNAFARLKPELAAFDARSLGLDFEVPMIFLQGADDAHLPTHDVAAYAADLRAPAKHFEALPGAGHSAVFLRELFLERLSGALKRLAA
jgi:proline iminopeptidase